MAYFGSILYQSVFITFWQGDAPIGSCRRVGPAIDLPQLLYSDMGVDLSGGDAGMAQHLLNMAQSGPVLKHQGCCTVAPHVTGAGLVDACSMDILSPQPAELARREGQALG